MQSATGTGDSRREDLALRKDAIRMGVLFITRRSAAAIPAYSTIIFCCNM